MSVMTPSASPGCQPTISINAMPCTLQWRGKLGACLIAACSAVSSRRTLKFVRFYLTCPLNLPSNTISIRENLTRASTEWVIPVRMQRCKCHNVSHLIWIKLLINHLTELQKMFSQSTSWLKKFGPVTSQSAPHSSLCSVSISPLYCNAPQITLAIVNDPTAVPEKLLQKWTGWTQRDRGVHRNCLGFF